MRIRGFFIIILYGCISAATDRVSASPVASTRIRRAALVGKRSIVHKKPVNVRSTAWLDGLKNGLASAMAAACVKTSLQPIDAIKTIQQFHQSSSGSSLSFLAACRKIMAGPGGFWNFYAGLGVTVFGAMPGVALYFGVYSYCKTNLGRTAFGNRHKLPTIALSAAIGNSVASFSRVPYEVLKQKLQTGAYSSTWEAFRQIAKAENGWLSVIFPKGGIAIQMFRDVPYAVCTLLLYESLQSAYKKSRLRQATGGEKVHNGSRSVSDFVLGGMAGGIGSWVTNPMDVIKTNLQTDSQRYEGSIALCAKEIWADGGAAAFLRGSVPRLMHKVPANAFFFLFYEIFRRILRVNDEIA